MSSNNNNNKKKERGDLFEGKKALQAEYDKGREPELLSSRRGTRQYSISALLEIIVTTFIDEHGGDSQALQDAETETEKLKLVLATVDYVLAVESVNVTADFKAEIIKSAYAELFSYGPLDKLFKDERVTTITFEGADKAFVRYGHGEMVSVSPLFETEGHLKKIARRLLLDSGTDVNDEVSLIETGLMIGERRVCVNLVFPPVTFFLTADIRVHPVELPKMDDLIKSEILTQQAAKILEAIAKSTHGFIIVGDTESGKTTLLGIMAAFTAIEQQKAMIAVERAGELHLPEGVERLVVQWASEGKDDIPLYERVNQALETNPACLLLDEVRADEAQAIAPLLTCDEPPRQIWTFRGTADSKRLISSLGMLARRSDTTQGEAVVQALYRRLPFVVTIRRRKGKLQLTGISEWQFPKDAEYADYVELMEVGWEGLELTGKRPAHDLDLADDFWD
jgi:pilus assembly protein CpaF